VRKPSGLGAFGTSCLRTLVEATYFFGMVGFVGAGGLLGVVGVFGVFGEFGAVRSFGWVAGVLRRVYSRYCSGVRMPSNSLLRRSVKVW